MIDQKLGASRNRPRNLTTSEKPVVGLQPVSREAMETILPREKAEGSGVERQKQHSTF